MVSYPTITAQLVTEIQPHRFEGEASDLGLPPGHWPFRLDTTLGNRRTLVFDKVQKEDDEVIAVRYIQPAGCVTLTIFND